MIVSSVIPAHTGESSAYYTSSLNPELLSQWAIINYFCPPTARSSAAASHVDDASSQHSSDMSDTRTEHSDEDAGEKTAKRNTGVKTTKKPAAAKTEVGHV